MRPRRPSPIPATLRLPIVRLALAALLVVPASQAGPGAHREPGRPLPKAELAARMEAVARELETLARLLPCEQSHGRIGYYGRLADEATVTVDLGEEARPDEVVLFPARLPTDAGGGDRSFAFPLAFELLLANEPAFRSPVRIAAWRAPESASGEPPFLRFPGIGATGRYLRIRVLEGTPRPSGGGRFFTLGEIVVLEAGRNLALGKTAQGSSPYDNPPRWRAANLTDGAFWCLPLRGAGESTSNGYHSAIEAQDRVPPKWVEVDLGENRAADEIHLVPARPRDFPDAAGFGFPPRFRVLAYGDGPEPRPVYETGREPFPNPGSATVMLPLDGRPLRRVRVECEELWQRSGDYIFALAELQVWSGGTNLAAQRPVSARDAVETGRWSLEALTDGHSSRQELVDWTEWLDAVEQRSALEEELTFLAAALAQNRELSRRRALLALALLAAASGLGAAGLVLWQRRRAALAGTALRQRIAADLHDELGARLSQIAIQSDLAGAQLPDAHPAAKRLADLAETARRGIDDMRDIVWLLGPGAGLREDLVPRLEGIAGRLLDGVPHRFRSEGAPPPGGLPVERARELVLFLKEALANARRHAPGAAVEVRLLWESAGLRLLVSDEGPGFDPAKHPAGHGLGNLARRARHLGGECRIESAPGAGTQVELSAPYAAKRRAPLRSPAREDDDVPPPDSA